MDQDISFCTTSDGVTIAYATLGDGPPVVYVCGWPGHLQMEWDTEFSREFITELGAGVKLVRYDMRGSGLSDSDIERVSLESSILDLAAVIDDVGPPVTLMSLGFLAGPVAMTYASKYPDYVTSLILSSAFLRGPDLGDEERNQALIAFIRTSGFPIDINTMREGTEKQFRGVAQIQRESASREVQAQVAEAMLGADVSDLPDKVTMPALVIHGRRDRVVPFKHGRALASRLPNVKFFPFEGASSAPWQHVDVIAREIRSFLGVEVQTRPATGATVDVHTILFTDIEGSTALTERLGDAASRELLREHERITREALQQHGGSEVKTMGDGFIASFPSATNGLECAIALQSAFAKRNESADEQLMIRVGLNAGEPIAEDDPSGRGDLFGTTINLTARICAKAEAGEILASNVVRELVAGKGFLFGDRGEFVAKGFEDPVRIYEVRWRSS